MLLLLLRLRGHLRLLLLLLLRLLRVGCELRGQTGAVSAVAQLLLLWLLLRLLALRLRLHGGEVRLRSCRSLNNGNAMGSANPTAM